MLLASLIVSAVAGCLVFLRSQWVPCCGREQFCEVRLGTISDAKAANVFCIFVLRFVYHGENSSFLAHLCCQRVWGQQADGFKWTASHWTGGPVQVQVCGSESVCFSKNAVRILSPFVGHDFVAKNWAPSKFEAAARCARAHFPATILGPLLFKICGPLTCIFASSDGIFAWCQVWATAASQ